ncbi:MAG: MlaD family protein [Solirubrobacteraceae bacterium]|nr:MlaD family protein [Solirubrobacteraceae bacterium]
MRRLRTFVLAAIAIAIVVVLATRGADDRNYRLAVVFDTGRGMVPGQLVKIAGARVGTIEKVRLTADRKARMEVRIEDRFAPFHDDASCKILPEGFISESFVQCDPGTPGEPELAEQDGLPTVPVERTEVSVQLQQVVDTFSLPVSERIRVILTELGVAASGRNAADLNAVLRRANPALEQANRLLAVLDGQREQIRAAVRDTDAVLVELAGRDRDLRRFVASAADVVRTTDAHRPGMKASLEEFGPLLTQARRSLTSLDTVGDKLTPTVEALQRSAPGLTRLNGVLRGLAKDGVPALRSLESAARVTRKAVEPTRPVLRQLTRFGSDVRTPMQLANDLLISLRDTGGVEQVSNFLYTLSTTSSAYDKTSHMVPIGLGFRLQCFVDREAPGCSHNFRAPEQGRIPINDPSWSGSYSTEHHENDPNVARSRSAAVRSRVSAASKGAEPGKPADPVSIADMPQTVQDALRTVVERLSK